MRAGPAHPGSHWADNIFANLAHLHPSFDFTTVTEPLEGRLSSKLNSSVWDDVERYVQRFQRVEVEDPVKEGGGEAGAEEEDDEAVDGEDNDNPAA